MPLIEATQWVKHGDHSQVQNLPPPDPYQQISENPFCSLCGNHMTRHGFLDGVNGEEVVCPGDYIVTDRNDLPYRLSRGEFESQYEVYVRPPRHANVPVSDLEERNRRKRERHEIS
jgi:hypothetical protein